MAKILEIENCCPDCILPEAVLWRCSVKKFLKILPDSQEKTCARVAKPPVAAFDPLFVVFLVFSALVSSSEKTKEKIKLKKFLVLHQIKRNLKLNKCG